MPFSDREVLETLRMVEMEHLDIRTVTLGINLLDCADSRLENVAEKIYKKVTRVARQLVPTCEEIEGELGVPIVNKRLSVTPIALVVEPATSAGETDLTPVAQALDRAAKEVGVNFVGGFSALVHKGITGGDKALIDSLPSALAATDRVCSSVNVASRRAGINMDAVALMGERIKDVAARTADKGGLGCAKLVIFSNIPEDNPFMAGAMHGTGEPELVINVGVSGPGVVAEALKRLGPDADLLAVAETIKRTAFKITRVGELAGRDAAKRLGIPFGIVDLSLAPTPAKGDSVAEILELMGLARAGAPGTTAALALLTDAVKKGGAMASSSVGGLSGAFIPVSEDGAMDDAVREGALTIEKLEAMSSVCSVGLDMVVIPGDTPKETIAGIIADEMAIGVINGKTTAVRIIPVPGKKAGDRVEFGGLLGGGTIMNVSTFSSRLFINRGGRIPAPIQSMTN
ncbi:MAG: PFL family protein [Planctomycetota bacterium]